jgi:predicted Holliday junction resolvase-like endonuclease
MLAQSLEPSQFLGPTGVTVLALAMLLMLTRSAVWLLNRLLESKDHELAELRQARDEWKEIALKGVSAAEKSTHIAEAVVKDDVTAEIRRLQAQVDELHRRDEKA